jgi:hypothetical protein
VWSTSCIAGLRRQCYYVVFDGPTKECPGIFVECPGVGKECPGEIMLIIMLVTNKIAYFMKD